MLVVKFGGTSVGKPERMKKIGELVLAMPGKRIVVLSALSGTTNALVRISDPEEGGHEWEFQAQMHGPA